VTAMVFLTTYRLVVGVSGRVHRLRNANAGGGNDGRGDGGIGRGVRTDGPLTGLAPLGPLDRPDSGGFLRRPT
jgi:hypothetical protein